MISVMCHSVISSCHRLEQDKVQGDLMITWRDVAVFAARFVVTVLVFALLAGWCNLVESI